MFDLVEEDEKKMCMKFVVEVWWECGFDLDLIELIYFD